MTPTRRLLFFVICLALTACSESGAPPDVAPELPDEVEAMAPVEQRPPVDHEQVARVQALSDWLSGCAVSDELFVRHKLYTWTHADQIEALRDTPTLLSRERTASGDLSLFDETIADDDHPLARRLRRRGQRARRFAWVTPWPTRMGWEESDYGDRLIEVTLRDDAWTAHFEPNGEVRWRVFDAEGEPIPEARVRRSPERVGAVYHIPSSARAFREVVLVNEDQIDHWSVATDAIRVRVDADAAHLRVLATHWRAAAPVSPEPFGAWLRAGWPAPPDAPGLLDRYRQCLALGSDAYVPTPEHLDAIADALEGMPEDEPIERTVRRRRRRTYGMGPQPQTSGLPFCDPTMGCWSP